MRKSALKVLRKFSLDTLVFSLHPSLLNRSQTLFRSNKKIFLMISLRQWVTSCDILNLHTKQYCDHLLWWEEYSTKPYFCWLKDYSTNRISVDEKKILQTVFLLEKGRRPCWCHTGWTSSGVSLQSCNSKPIISIMRILSFQCYLSFPSPYK